MVQHVSIEGGREGGGGRQEGRKGGRQAGRLGWTDRRTDGGGREGGRKDGGWERGRKGESEGVVKIAFFFPKVLPCLKDKTNSL